MLKASRRGQDKRGRRRKWNFMGTCSHLSVMIGCL